MKYLLLILLILCGCEKPYNEPLRCFEIRSEGKPPVIIRAHYMLSNNGKAEEVEFFEITHSDFFNGKQRRQVGATYNVRSARIVDCEVIKENGG